jgi:hypothetical protein
MISLRRGSSGDQTLAIGVFMEFLDPGSEENRIDKTLPLDIRPHVISISDIEAKEKNIRVFLENAITLSLAHIASEL